MGIGLFFFGAAGLVSSARFQNAMGSRSAIQDSVHPTHDCYCAAAQCRSSRAQLMKEGACSGLHKGFTGDPQPSERTL